MRVEGCVKAHVGNHVDGSVEEGEESQQAPELDEKAEAGPELTQGSDGERDDQQVESGVARGKLNPSCRVWPEIIGDGAVDEDS